MSLISDDPNIQIKEIYEFLSQKLNFPQNVVGLTLHMYPGEPIQVHLQYIPMLSSVREGKELKH